MQVVVNDLLTSYEVTGNGKNTILALHGWADTAQTFSSLAAELAKSGQYKFISLNLPGFGGTQFPQTGWELKDYAEFVTAFIEKISLEPDAIIGHSNGGAIAMYGLGNDVFHTKQLILIGSAGIRERTIRKLVLRMAAKPVKLALKIAPSSVQKKIKQKAYGAIGSDYMVAEHMTETFTRVVTQDIQADAARINVHTCLIYGENDNATPVEFGRRFNAIITNSELHIIPEAGHFVHKEQAYRTASIIKEFLQ